MARISKIHKRCDHILIENAHPKSLHYENGVPIFVGDDYRISKKLTYTTTRCPECDSIARFDENGDEVCVNEECGVVCSAGNFIVNDAIASHMDVSDFK